jgi:hypothetical protein
LEDEIYVFENFEKHSKEPTCIIPLMWEAKLIKKSFKSGYITSARIYLHFFYIIQDFRSSLESLSVYNEFNIPLVYAQVLS